MDWRQNTPSLPAGLVLGEAAALTVGAGVGGGDGSQALDSGGAAWTAPPGLDVDSLLHRLERIEQKIDALATSVAVLANSVAAVANAVLPPQPALQ